MAKCPKCEHSLNELELTAVPGRVGSEANTRSLKCVLYACPHCKGAIAASIDPIALKTDIVNSIKRSR